MGDAGEYWREHREYVRNRWRKDELPIIAGVRHSCGGEVVLLWKGQRRCNRCGDKWRERDDSVQMVGARMGTVTREDAL